MGVVLRMVRTDAAATRAPTSLAVRCGRRRVRPCVSSGGERHRAGTCTPGRGQGSCVQRQRLGEGRAEGRVTHLHDHTARLRARHTRRVNVCEGILARRVHADVARHAREAHVAGCKHTSKCGQRPSLVPQARGILRPVESTLMCTASVGSHTLCSVGTGLWHQSGVPGICAAGTGSLCHASQACPHLTPTLTVARHGT